MEEAIPNGDISGSHVKIGTESHGSRNVLIIVGLVVAVGAAALFYKMSATNDEPKLKALADFRAAVSQKCPAINFSGDEKFVQDQFLNSPNLLDVVQKQAAALNSGTSCEDVEHALRAASFPLAQKK